MAMDVGAFYTNVVITLIIVVTFFFLILAFLYLIYGKEERSVTAERGTPKTRSITP